MKSLSGPLHRWLEQKFATSIFVAGSDADIKFLLNSYYCDQERKLKTPLGSILIQSWVALPERSTTQGFALCNPYCSHSASSWQISLSPFHSPANCYLLSCCWTLWSHRQTCSTKARETETKTIRLHDYCYIMLARKKVGNTCRLSEVGTKWTKTYLLARLTNLPRTLSYSQTNRPVGLVTFELIEQPCILSGITRLYDAIHVSTSKYPERFVP